MTKREAKREVCRMIADLVDPDVHNNEFLYADRSDFDADQMLNALQELVDELRRRGGER